MTRARRSIAEQTDELHAAFATAMLALVRELAASRLGRLLGWFYEWERARIGDRLAKAATILLAANILWLWPVVVIEQVLGLIGVGS